MIRKQERVPESPLSGVTRDPFPSAEKVHFEGSRPDLRVPMRRVIEMVRSLLNRLWPWLPILGVWALACGNLSVHWSANPIYSYGWLVPAFGLYAIIARWKSRPPPGKSNPVGRVVAWLAAIAFFPTWTFAQPNPDWSLIAWLLSAEAVAMTLGAIGIAGGWPWVRHFAFPICLIFAAVPCPRVFEAPMTVGLMRWVAAFTVELLNVSGVAAVQHGNVIEVRTGLLGVDEACSGVRSLQAALTASLFLGELHRFLWRRRLLLLGTGLVAAVVTNIARTFFLAWTASREGLPAVGKWHDPAGFLILSVCFAVVWVTALFLARSESHPAMGPSPALARPLPAGFATGLSLWMLSTIVAVELWFHEGGEPPESPWSLLPPDGSVPIQIGEEAARQLQCDQSSAVAWREGDGSDWLMYFLEWRPGPIRSRVLARIHRPDICLSSVGLKLIADRGMVPVEAAGFTLVFHAYAFEQDGRPLFVYYGIWQNRSQRARESGNLSPSEHLAGLQAVIWRERRLGQLVAELAATGYANAAQADVGFQETLKKLLVRRLPPVNGG